LPRRGWLRYTRPLYAVSLGMLCLLLFYRSSLYSQDIAPGLRVGHLSQEQGLSEDIILCILQDSRGFLWFGTQDGLNRYDGHQFKIYRSGPGNPHSLSSSTISAMIEGKDGSLWIATYGGGVNRFDRQKEIFTHFMNDPENPDSLVSNQVLAIRRDRDGHIWLGTGKGLERLDPKNGKFIHYRHDAANPASLGHNDVRSILEDRQGALWVGTTQGLNRLDPDKGKFTRFLADPAVPGSISFNDIWTIYEDPSGELWIGTKKGLNRFDRQTGTFKVYLNDPKNPASLSNNEIRAIYQDSSGLLWVGTADGLNLFNRERETFIRYFSKPEVPHSLSSNNIMVIYEDRTGVLWIGTQDNGIDKWNKDQHRFTHYRVIPGHPLGLTSNYIGALFEDRTGCLWVGTNNGLDQSNPDKTRFTHFKADPLTPGSLSDKYIWSICEDHTGVIWVGTSAGGLNRLNRQKGTFTHYLNSAKDPHSLSNNRVLCLYEDRNGCLWVGTSSGLNALGPGRERFTSFKHEPDNPHSLSHDTIWAISEDKSGDLWIGTLNGLNRYNPDSKTFIRYMSDPILPGRLRNEKINCFCRGRQGTLWIGSYGGLAKYDSRRDRFHTYTIKDGLPSDVVLGIREDRAGRLWISTNNGLSCFDPQTGLFKNYDAWDGLQGNTFNTNAFSASKNGRLFFGGTNGLTAFSPEKIQDNLHIPPVVITDFQLFNKKVATGEKIDGTVLLPRPIDETREITLSFRQSSFTIGYAALHFNVPGRNRYAYKMEGLEKDWNDVGNRPFATYALLPFGRYLFRVKGTNSDGVWNETGAALKITITPPPWRTWWAYILYVLAIGASLSGYIRSQKKKLAREKATNERLRQVDHLKDQFLANTSHELRTPLTGIIGIADSLLKGATGPLPEETAANLRLVVMSGKRLSNLINDILDYSRLKEKDLALQSGPVDMKSLTEVVLFQLKPLTNGKSLELCNKIGSDLPLVWGDENRLQQIMHNLLGNAIKFSESGSVTVTAEETDNMVNILVKDTGIGIPADKLELIFQSFEQVDTSTAREYGGTGLGLSITRKLVELHGGTIGVQSQPGLGSSFWFTLPISPGKSPSSPSPTQPLPSTMPPTLLWPSSTEEKISLALKTREPGSFRILAVDDEMINLQVLVNHLSLHQYEVITAINGQQALDLIKNDRERPDLVLLDVMMPHLSGYEVCRRIRDVFPASELPVIMLTAKNQLPNLIEGLESGANDYLTKPFSSEELLERINVHLQLLQANRNLKGANEKLEDYNRNLEQKVAERTREVKEKNRLILESIIFAQRMQEDILPAEEKIKSAWPEHFVLFRPREIVSGDFYWFEQAGDHSFIAVVDCTGHGVPGALMAMIGYTLLNKVVIEQHILDPREILAYLHQNLTTVIKHRRDSHIDTAGMDICLCRIENRAGTKKTGKRITFAGAHLPLFIVRKNQGECLEIKGDRYPIGGLQMTGNRTYTQHEIDLLPGDMIYLASDGFAHQQDPQDRKYGKQRLLQFFANSAGLTMEKQRQKLQAELENHKGCENQRDDITLFGVRIL